MTVSCNTKVMTLQRLFSDVLKSSAGGGLGMNEPSIDVLSGQTIGLEIEDDRPDNTAYLKRTLESHRIVNGSILSIDDFGQSMQCQIKILHREDLKEEEFPLVRSYPSASLD